MDNLKYLLALAKDHNIEVLVRTDRSGFFMHVYGKSGFNVDSVYKGYSINLDMLIRNGVEAVMEAICK